MYSEDFRKSFEWRMEKDREMQLEMENNKNREQ
jgi:hypothetical protein